MQVPSAVHVAWSHHSTHTVVCGLLLHATRRGLPRAYCDLWRAHTALVRFCRSQETHESCPVRGAIATRAACNVVLDAAYCNHMQRDQMHAITTYLTHPHAHSPAQGPHLHLAPS